MSSNSFFRIIRLGVVNFWRNRWLTLGATLLMTLTLTMMSVSVLMTYLLRDTATAIGTKIDLTIYFPDDSVADQKITDLGTRIGSIPNVTNVHFVTKDEALQIWNRLPINENIKQPINASNNPLPRSLEVNTSSPDVINSVASSIGQADTDKLICDECVSYAKNKDTVDRLVSVTKLVQRAGLLGSLFFGIIAIFNVLNIIRITIMARSDEIEIMRYVGASNGFVRGPFVVEGVLYGLFGTLFTSIFLLSIGKIAQSYVGNAAVSFFQLIDIDFYQYILSHIWILIGVQLGVGVLLGVIVSSLSIRRYLRA